MMSECKHTGFYSNVHCSGCGEYAPKIIANLQTENAGLKKESHHWQHKFIAEERACAELEAKLERLEEEIDYWKEEALMSQENFDG